MKTTLFTFALLLFFFLPPFLSFAQPVPAGNRLKDIVDKPLVGALFKEGTQNETVFFREFNTGTVNWYPRWNGWLSRNEFNFSDFNSRVNKLSANGRSIMMHMFVGPNTYLPDWFKNGTWSATDMEEMLENMIRSMMQSNNNATAIATWNIVNEVFDYNGDGFESTKLHEMGYEDDASGLSGQDKVFNQFPVYVRKAFEYAAKYTNNDLELRDYKIEFASSKKFRAFYQLVKHLLNKNIRLKAVGLQCHFSIQDVNNYNWNDFKTAIVKLKALGLKVHLTELDIADSEKSWNSTKAEIQKQIYYNCIKAACEAGVESIHNWGIIDNADPGWLVDQSPLLFDNSYNPKPAYYGYQSALNDFRSGSGTGNIIIRASGSTGEEQMELYVDDVKQGNTQAVNTIVTDYSFPVNKSSGNIKIKFINDINTGTDRNLKVDYVVANGSTYQAEEQTTNTGAWNSSLQQCGGVQSEWLHCNGYIDFGTLVITSSPGIVNGGVYRLRSELGNKYLHSEGDAAGSNVSVQDLVTDWTSEKWTLELVAGNTYRLKCNWGNKYLNAQGNTNGSNVGVANLNNDWYSERWTLEFISGNTYRLKCNWGDKYLNTDGNTSGSNVNVAGLNTTLSSQKWILESVAGNSREAAANHSLVKSVQVYPNPLSAGQALNIRLGNIPGAIVTVNVIDNSGKVLYEKRAVANNLFTIPKSVFPAKGVYMIRINKSDGPEIHKVIILD